MVAQVTIQKIGKYYRDETILKLLTKTSLGQKHSKILVINLNQINNMIEKFNSSDRERKKKKENKALKMVN